MNFKQNACYIFLESNTDLNLFKTIHLGRKSNSWSGGQILIIEKAIDYYKTIKSKIKELQKEQYLGHILYIENIIRNYESYKKQIEIKEFLSDW